MWKYIYLIPLVVVVIALLKTDLENRKVVRGIYFLGLFLSFFIIGITIANLSENFFSFVPESWGGYTEDGYYESSKAGIAKIVGMVISGTFLYLVEQHRVNMVEKEKGRDL